MPVYFIRAGEDGPVKIGHARDPRRRLAMLQTGNAAPLAIIRLVEGGREEEAAAHAQFAVARLSGEWFAFCEAMLTFGRPVEGITPPKRLQRITFHPLVEEVIRDGSYSDQAVSQWRKRGVPYEVCCRALVIADSRGLPVDATMATYRNPIVGGHVRPSPTTQTEAA
jgi:hypothetical protein